MPRHSTPALRRRYQPRITPRHAGQCQPWPAVPCRTTGGAKPRSRDHPTTPTRNIAGRGLRTCRTRSDQVSLTLVLEPDLLAHRNLLRRHFLPCSISLASAISAVAINLPAGLGLVGRYLNDSTITPFVPTVAKRAGDGRGLYSDLVMGRLARNHLANRCSWRIAYLSYFTTDRSPRVSAFCTPATCASAAIRVISFSDRDPTTMQTWSPKIDTYMVNGTTGAV